MRAERDRWFSGLALRKKNERLFELEIYIKALDRFCNVRNNPITEGTNLCERNFAPEMMILKEALARIISCVRALIPGKQSSAFHFQTFVEQRLLNDRARMDWMEKCLLQQTPEESLYVLESAIENIREIVSSLAELEKVPHSLFQTVGRMINR